MADERARRYHHYYPPYPGHPQHFPPPHYPPGWVVPPPRPVPDEGDCERLPDPDQDVLTFPNPEPEPEPESPPPPPPFGYYGYGYRWVDCDANTGIFSTSVQGGIDQDGTHLYVGRAYHAGDWIPAKVIPEKNVAYVAHDGKEIAVYQYQVLCEQRFDWEPCSDSNIPANAVVGGRTSDGEPLYVGRAFHDGSHTIGKVHPSHGSCYIPFGGEEHAYNEYEILVLR